MEAKLLTVSTSYNNILPHNSNMSRRQLPPRATRGQRPQRTQEQLQTDNAFYQSLFGAQQLQPPQQAQQDEQARLAEQSRREQELIKQQARQTRRQLMAANLPTHSYARAHHYFFDLNRFPRLPGHPSYATDLHNAFNLHFSQDQRTLLGSKLSDLINRVYFGLPVTNRDERVEEKSKNACHAVLFEGEDRKYALDRMIYSCKCIFRRLQELERDGKVGEFKYVARKEGELEQLSDPEVGLAEKREMLERVIEEYQGRKEANRLGHQYEDGLHFYFSLDQRMHNRMAELQQKISLSIIPNIIFGKEMQLIRAIRQSPESLGRVLRKTFMYHQSETTAISAHVIDNLVAQYPNILLALKEDAALVNLPCQIYNFGSVKLMEMADRIIALKILKVNGQLGYYSAKFAWAKLFKRQLIMEKNIPKINYGQYKSKIEVFVNAYKEYEHRKEVNQINVNQHALDEYVNFQNLNYQSQGPIFILKRKNPIIISNKQLLIINLYSWICKAVIYIYPLLEQNPDFIYLFTSQFYSKLHLHVTEVVGSPYFGVFYHTLQCFTQYITTSGPMYDFNVAVEFDYDQQRGTGTVWKFQLPEEEEVGDWEELAEQEEGENQEEEAEEQEQLEVDGEERGRDGRRAEYMELPKINSREVVQQKDDVEQILGGYPRKIIKQNDDVQ